MSNNRTKRAGIDTRTITPQTNNCNTTTRTFNETEMSYEDVYNSNCAESSENEKHAQKGRCGTQDPQSRSIRAHCKIAGLDSEELSFEVVSKITARPNPIFGRRVKEVFSLQR